MKCNAYSASCNAVVERKIKGKTLDSAWNNGKERKEYKPRVAGREHPAFHVATSEKLFISSL